MRGALRRGEAGAPAESEAKVRDHLGDESRIAHSGIVRHERSFEHCSRQNRHQKKLISMLTKFDKHPKKTLSPPRTFSDFLMPINVVLMPTV